ncbi:hypothetical protein [Nocardioides sp. SYSU D00038]|uniref:hypothetical protein n=1 Tax=Nocardioides sp. SYSU D00038 TaxID=2812554 RepID=UPI0019670A46|nr:hypothetical protein [Nocardioides sp. SYSU D00038]
MTHDDLQTLLREHVARDEPSTMLPLPAIGAGRRRLRARRAVASVATVAAVGALAGVAPALQGQLTDGGGREVAAIDPRSQAALDDYDVRRMPALMDAHVRPVLERGQPALGEPVFKAWDDQGQSLPEKYWPRASGLDVSYGDRQHEYVVSIMHARGEAEGDHAAVCADDLAQGYALECTATTDADGNAVVSRLVALKPMARNPRAGWMTVDRERLETVGLDRLFFQRQVEVIKSETLLTQASETVKATDRDPARAGFTASYADLAEIGSDPVLVMPRPPKGENGCDAWTMPTKGLEGVSCE